MQKTLNDMARYIKNIIPPNIPENYTVKAMFENISGEENIRKGILAFRDILYLICDRLIADGSLYEKPVKNTEKIDAHQSLAGSFPFLNNIKSILFNIGINGELIENGEFLFLDDLNLITPIIDGDGWAKKAKISTPKLIEALKFLSSCGFYFNGIKFDLRTLEMSKTTPIKISYPDNPVLLTGLKVMAISQRTFHAKGNHDIFLRCDYRVVKEEETEEFTSLEDFITPWPTEVQKFARNLHQCSINSGLTCKVDAFYLNIRFIYSHKNKEIWTFSAALESGYRILIKAQNTHKYSDVIETFPLSLQEKISRGYGCNRKLFGEPCQGGCHGFSFPLDESILDIGPYIEVWLNKEASCLQRKKAVV